MITAEWNIYLGDLNTNRIAARFSELATISVTMTDYAWSVDARQDGEDYTVLVTGSLDNEPFRVMLLTLCESGLEPFIITTNRYSDYAYLRQHTGVVDIIHYNDRGNNDE